MYTYISPIRRIARERRARSRAHVVFMSSSNSSVFDMVFDAAPFASSAHSYTHRAAASRTRRAAPVAFKHAREPGRAALAGVQPWRAADAVARTSRGTPRRARGRRRAAERGGGGRRGRAPAALAPRRAVVLGVGDRHAGQRAEVVARTLRARERGSAAPHGARRPGARRAEGRRRAPCRPCPGSWHDVRAARERAERRRSAARSPRRARARRLAALAPLHIVAVDAVEEEQAAARRPSGSAACRTARARRRSARRARTTARRSRVRPG